MSDSAPPVAIVSRGRREPGERLTPDLVLVCPELAPQAETEEVSELEGEAAPEPEAEPAAPPLPLDILLRGHDHGPPRLERPLVEVAALGRAHDRRPRSAASPIAAADHAHDEHRPVRPVNSDSPERRRAVAHGNGRQVTESRGQRARYAVVAALLLLVGANIGVPRAASWLRIGAEHEREAVPPIHRPAAPARAGYDTRRASEAGRAHEIQAADLVGGQVKRAVTQRGASTAVAVGARIPAAGALPKGAHATATRDEGSEHDQTRDSPPIGSGRSGPDPLELAEPELVGMPSVRMPTGPLFAPDAGVRVVSPPTLSWDPVANVRGYRLQLFRGAGLVLEKRLVESSLALHLQWQYAGQRYAFSRGLYRWVVWREPARPADGTLLKASSFVFVGRIA